MEKIYVGIDIGNSGAIAVMQDGQISDIFEMPVTTLAKRKTSCRQGIKHLLQFPQEAVVIVEECSQHLQSQKTAASMWFGFRGVLDAIEECHLRYVIVSPKTWQKEFSFKSGNTKGQSIATCKSLFPTLSLKRTDSSKNDDDNFSDAVLLAEYGRRNNL